MQYNLLWIFLLISIYYRINCVETTESSKEYNILDIRSNNNTKPPENDIWDNKLFIFAIGAVIIVSLTAIIILIIYYYIKCDHCPRKRKENYTYQPINTTTNMEETVKLKAEDDVDPMSPDSDSDEEPSIFEDL